MSRYRPERVPRVLALLGAAAFTTTVLAAVNLEAHRAEAAPVMAEFTGEVTADGPVYRLPRIEVRTRAGFVLALPVAVDRALAAQKAAPAPTRPNA
jgi:hypothetical protein